MARLVLTRIALMIPTLFLVMVIIFLLVRLLPGDPALAMAGDRASDAQIALIRDQLGLNEPWIVQFWRFVTRVLAGDLGRSILMRAPVAQVIAERLPVTLALAVYAVGLALAIAGPLAFVAALNRGRWPDALIRGVFQVGLSMPVFYVGLVLLAFLAAKLRLFPVGGAGQGVAGQLYHLFLPAVAIALYTSAIILRNLRAAIIEVLDAEYVAFARAKGLPRRVVLGRHVLRNAMISTVTLVGLSIGNLMSGTLVTETVFAVPGLGRLMLEAIYARDYPLIQGLTLSFAVLVSIVFLLTDLFQSWLDPRMRAA